MFIVFASYKTYSRNCDYVIEAVCNITVVTQISFQCSLWTAWSRSVFERYSITTITILNLWTDLYLMIMNISEKVNNYTDLFECNINCHGIGRQVSCLAADIHYSGGWAQFRLDSKNCVHLGFNGMCGRAVTNRMSMYTLIHDALNSDFTFTPH